MTQPTAVFGSLPLPLMSLAAAVKVPDLKVWGYLENPDAATSSIDTFRDTSANAADAVTNVGSTGQRPLPPLAAQHEAVAMDADSDLDAVLGLGDLSPPLVTTSQLQQQPASQSHQHHDANHIIGLPASPLAHFPSMQSSSSSSSSGAGQGIDADTPSSPSNSQQLHHHHDHQTTSSSSSSSSSSSASALDDSCLLSLSPPASPPPLYGSSGPPPLPSAATLLASMAYLPSLASLSSSSSLSFPALPPMSCFPLSSSSSSSSSTFALSSFHPPLPPPPPPLPSTTAANDMTMSGPPLPPQPLPRPIRLLSETTTTIASSLLALSTSRVRLLNPEAAANNNNSANNSRGRKRWPARGKQKTAAAAAAATIKPGTNNAVAMYEQKRHKKRQAEREQVSQGERQEDNLVNVMQKIDACVDAMRHDAYRFVSDAFAFPNKMTPDLWDAYLPPGEAGRNKYVHTDANGDVKKKTFTKDTNNIEVISTFYYVLQAKHEREQFGHVRTLMQLVVDCVHKLRQDRYQRRAREVIRNGEHTTKLDQKTSVPVLPYSDVRHLVFSDKLNWPDIQATTRARVAKNKHLCISALNRHASAKPNSHPHTRDKTIRLDYPVPPPLGMNPLVLPPPAAASSSSSSSSSSSNGTTTPRASAQDAALAVARLVAASPSSSSSSSSSASSTFTPLPRLPQRSSTFADTFGQIVQDVHGAITGQVVDPLPSTMLPRRTSSSLASSSMTSSSSTSGLAATTTASTRPVIVLPRPGSLVPPVAPIHFINLPSATGSYIRRTPRVCLLTQWRKRQQSVSLLPTARIVDM